MNPRSVLCEDGKPCLDFPTCHQNCECIRGLGRNVLLKDESASQPNPTPQELTAPTLEQLDEQIRQDIDSLGADARRYYFLRQCCFGWQGTGKKKYKAIVFIFDGSMEELDKAIDDAMGHE